MIIIIIVDGRRCPSHRLTLGPLFPQIAKMVSAWSLQELHSQLFSKEFPLLLHYTEGVHNTSPHYGDDG